MSSPGTCTKVGKPKLIDELLETVQTSLGVKSFGWKEQFVGRDL